MPSPQFDAIVQLLQASPNPDKLPWAAQRNGMEKMAAQTPLPDDVYSEMVSAETVPALLLAKSGVDDQKMALYLHGGLFTLGSPTTHRDLAWRISEACGARVLLPDYRLAPRMPFPAAIEDVLTTYRWLLANGIAPENMLIIGDSAGANLMLSALLALRDSGGTLPKAAVALSPWVDLTLSAESLTTNDATDPIMTLKRLKRAAKDYLKKVSAEDPRVSPIFADLTGLPPLLIQAGTGEMLLDDARTLAEKATEAGIDCTLDLWEEMFHSWHAMAAILPEAQDALARMGEFARQQLAK